MVIPPAPVSNKNALIAGGFILEMTARYLCFAATQTPYDLF